MLEDAGFEVMIASDGAAAVEQVARQGDRLVAVLLDVTMPKLSGEEAFRQIRALQPGLPIIITSGHDEQEMAPRFAGQGMSGFLGKPWNVDELVDAIRAVQ